MVVAAIIAVCGFFVMSIAVAVCLLSWAEGVDVDVKIMRAQAIKHGDWEDDE